MSTTVDERVVIMEFDNADFEKNVKTSMNTLDKFKRKLNFADSADSFNDLEKSASRVKLKGLSEAFDGVSVKINAWSVVASAAISRVVNSAIEGGARIVKALSVDQLAAGWQKYEAITTAVQTMMAAITEDDKGDTSESARMKYVEEYMQYLTWMTDETSYNLTSMTDTIGKFVAAGVDLKTSVAAIEGIATWAALAGQNANVATRAMQQLAQALGSGAVTAQDWSSIETANMATKEAKEIFIQAAVAQGKLIEKDGKYYALKTKEGEVINAQLKTYINGMEDAVKADVDLSNAVEVTAENMRTTLSEKWFTTDVLNEGLKEYGAFADRLGKIIAGNDGFDNVLTKDWVKMVEAYDNAVSKTEKDRIIAEIAKETRTDTAIIERYVKELSGDYADYAKELDRINKIQAKSNSEKDIAAAEAEKAAAKESLLQSFMEETGLTAEEADKYLSELSNTTMDLGRKAFKAAQETKTLTEVLEATKEAVATKWMNIFKTIFGNYLEAKELWSDLSEKAYNIFVEPLNTLSDIAYELKDGGVFKAIFGISNQEAGEAKSLYETIFEAYDKLFGWNDESALVQAIVEFYDALNGTDARNNENGGIAGVVEDIIKRVTESVGKIREWSESLIPDDSKITAFKNAFHSIFAGFGIIKTSLGYIKQILQPVFSLISGIAERLFVGVNQSESLIIKFNRWFAQSKTIHAVVETIADSLNKVSSFILGIIDLVTGRDVSKPIDKVSGSVSNTVNIVDKLKNGLKTVSKYINENIFKGKFSGVVESINKILDTIGENIKRIREEFKKIQATDTIISFINLLFTALESGIKVINIVLPLLTTFFNKLSDVINNTITSGTQTKILELFNKIQEAFKRLHKALTGRDDFDVIETLSDSLTKAEKPLTTVALIIYRVSEALESLFESINGILETYTLVELFHMLYDFLRSEFMNVLNFIKEKAIPKLIEVFNSSKEFLSQIKPLIMMLSPLLIAGAVIISALNMILTIMKTFKEALYSVSDVFGLYARGEAKKYRAWASIILAFAALIGVIIYGVKELKDVDGALSMLKEIGKIVLELGIILFAVEAFSNGMDFLRSALPKLKNAKTFNMSETYKALAVLILSFTAIVYLLDNIPFENFAESIKKLAIIGVLAVAAMVLLTIANGLSKRLSGGKIGAVTQNIGQIAIIIAALLGLAYIVDKYVTDPIKSLEPVTQTLIWLVAVMLGASVLMSVGDEKKLKNGSKLIMTMSLFIASLAAMIYGLNWVLENGDPKSTFIALGAIMIGVTAFLAAIFALSRLGKSTNIQIRGIASLFISLGVVLAIISGLSMAIEKIGLVKFVTNMITLSSVFFVLTTCLTMLLKVPQQGKKIKDVGKVLFQLTGVIASLTLVAAMLEYLNNPIGDMIMLNLMIAAVTGSIAGLMALTKISNPASMAQVKTIMWSLIGAIGAIVFALEAMQINGNDYWKELGELGVIALGLGAAISGLIMLTYLWKKVGDPKSISSMAIMLLEFVAVLSVITGLVVYINTFGDLSMGLKTIGLLALGTLVLCTALIGLATIGLKAPQAIRSMSSISAMIGMFSVLLMTALGLMIIASGIDNSMKGLAVLGILSLGLLAVCSSLVVLSEFGSKHANTRGMIDVSALFGMFMSVLTTSVLVLGFVNAMGNVWNALGVLGALTAGLIATCAAIIALSMIGRSGKPNGLLKLVGMMLVFSLVVGKFVSLLETISKIQNAEKAGIVLFALSTMLLGMSAALIGLSIIGEKVNPSNIIKVTKILNNFKTSLLLIAGLLLILNRVHINKKDVFGVSVICVALGSLIASFAALSKIAKADSLATISAIIYNLTLSLLSIAALMVVMNFVKDPGSAIRLILVLLAGLTGVIAGLMVVSRYTNVFSLQDITKMMISLTACIAALIGCLALINLSGINEKDIKMMGLIMLMLTAMAGASAIIGKFAGKGLYAISIFLISLSASMLVFSVACLAIGGAVSILGKQLGTIGPVFKSVADAIIVFISTILDGLMSLMPKISETMGVIFKAIIDLVVENILYLLDVLNDKGIEIADKVLFLIEQILDVLIEHAPKITEQAVELALKVTVGMIRGLTEGLPTLLDEGVKFIIAFIGGLGDALEGNAEGLWEAVRKLIRGILNVFMTMLGIDEGKKNKILDKVDEIMKNIGPAIVAGAKSVINSVKTFCSNVWNTVSSKFAELKNDIKSKLNEVWGSIQDKFEEWKRNFKNYGRNIIDGLVEGFKETIQKVKDTVGNIADTVMGVFTSKTKINSPSKVFKEYGQYIDEGLIIGMNNYADKAAYAAENVGEDVMDAFSEAIALASDLVTNGMDSEPTIRPVIDLSNIQNGMNTIDGMLDRNYSVGTSANYARSVAGYSSRTASASDTITNTTTNNEAVYNTFNITGDNPKEIAEEVSRIIQQQIGRRNNVWA